MWWIAVAAAADMSFQCTDTATLPEDVLAWDGATASEPGNDAWDLAYAWYDEACVTCTSDMSWSTCEATACVTAAGAVLDYRNEYVWSTDDYGDEETTITLLTVVPPASAGLGWSELTVAIDEQWSRSGASGGDSTDTTVSWRGELRADWPVDGGFRAGAWSSNWSFWASETGASWDDGACVWSVSERMDENRIHTVDMQGDSFDVTFTYAGTMAGECYTDTSAAHVDRVFVGVPDEDTWALLGTDADGDGWPVEYGDCDDADADENPCTPDPYDGVDTNCDGLYEHDLDHDGADGPADGGTDCDDNDAARYPGAVDVVCDDIDQDCDGTDDRDADDDGDACDTDCDDADPARSSLLEEIPCDGVDQDCDGLEECFTPPSAVEEPVEEEEPAPVEEDAGCGGGAAALLVLVPLGVGRRRRRSAG